MALLHGLTGRPDPSKLEQLEAERLDLRNDAEQRGPILERAGEHRLAVLDLRHHRGKGGQGGGSQPALYPDRVEVWRWAHATIVQPELVSRRRRNPVMFSRARWRRAGARVRVGRRKSGR